MFLLADEFSFETLPGVFFLFVNSFVLGRLSCAFYAIALFTGKIESTNHENLKNGTKVMNNFKLCLLFICRKRTNEILSH